MNITYPPLGYCAYCGATNSLSDEHIIPYSLGGTFVLPQASCRKCAEITSAFEMRLARGMFAKFRSRQRAPSRKKNLLKEAPAQITDYDSNNIHPVSVPEEAWHFSLPLISLPPPAALNYPPIRSDQIGEFSIDFIDFGPTDDAFWQTQPRGKITIRDQMIDFNSFFRLLAKIAHCAALAELGNRFDPWLIPYVLGKDTALPYLVGGTGTWSKYEGKHAFIVHDAVSGLRNFEGIRLVTCEVNLFSSIGTPNYLVLVGMSHSRSIISEAFASQLRSIFTYQ